MRALASLWKPGDKGAQPELPKAQAPNKVPLSPGFHLYYYGPHMNKMEPQSDRGFHSFRFYFHPHAREGLPGVHWPVARIPASQAIYSRGEKMGRNGIEMVFRPLGPRQVMLEPGKMPFELNPIDFDPEKIGGKLRRRISAEDAITSKAVTSMLGYLRKNHKIQEVVLGEQFNSLGGGKIPISLLLKRHSRIVHAFAEQSKQAK